MLSKLTRNAAISLGLAGSLAIALAPAAEAQVQVTGGLLQGDAAFFEPTTAADGISLFDINVTDLTLISPNGVLTNPIFVPTATGGFVDTNTDGRVNAGDTGLLQGSLTGVGFDANGFPIPFSQVGTVLQYNVGNFSSALSLPGTRVTATGIPQLFIPGAGLTVVGAGITANDGKMEIGSLAANVDDGLIALPSNIQFLGGSNSTGTIVSLFDVGRKVEFEFEGDSVDASNVNNDVIGSDGDIRLVADTNEFEIETVGGGSLKFEVAGGVGTLDFEVDNGFTVGSPNESGTFNPADPLDYEIEGQARGFLSLFSGNGIGFAGSNFSSGEPVEYEFSQANGFSSEGKLRGNVNFLLAAGQQNFDFDADFANFSAPNLSSNSLFVQTRNITTVDIDIENINVDGFSFSFKDGKFDFGDLDFDLSSDSDDDAEVALARQLFLLFLDDVDFSAFLNTLQGSIFALADDSDFADIKFAFYGRPVFFGYFRPSGPTRVRLVHRGSDRFLVASRPGRRRALGAIKMRGPNSRLFPGLVGLYQLSDEEVEDINDELALDGDLDEDEFDVDDDGDDEFDVDDDGDEDDDDVDDEDDDEDEDDDDGDDVEAEEPSPEEPTAEEPTPEVPVFEGLPLDDSLGEQLEAPADDTNSQ